jgi:hypothetical protein
MITLLLAAQIAVTNVSPVAPTQGIVWSGPKLSPDEAARILAVSPALTNLTNVALIPAANGPQGFIIPSSTAEGPFGPFREFPAESATQLLRILQVSDPPGMEWGELPCFTIHRRMALSISGR